MFGDPWLGMYWEGDVSRGTLKEISFSLQIPALKDSFGQPGVRTESILWICLVELRVGHSSLMLCEADGRAETCGSCSPWAASEEGRFSKGIDIKDVGCSLFIYMSTEVLFSCSNTIF